MTPWGFLEILSGSNSDGHKLTKITVFPGRQMSLQSYDGGPKHWFCVKGTGQAHIGNFYIDICISNRLLIERKQKHRLINESDDVLEVVEVQFGCGEENICQNDDS